jgi:hypothetical protein
MGEVTQFPTNKVQEEKLQKMTEEMEKVYRVLENLHEGLNELELRAAEMEASYNVEFRKLVDVVGVENISIGLLQYCTEAEDHMYGQED